MVVRSPRAEVAALSSVRAGAPIPEDGSPGGTALGGLSVVVRQARVGDIMAIIEMERLSFSDPWSTEAFVVALDRPEVRLTVAEVDGGRRRTVKVGYMMAWFVAGEGEIANIAVHPEWRGRGVGGALLDDLLAAGRAAGVSSIYLEVRESNEPARTLYARRGFTPVGRRRGYYDNPVEDAVVLRRAEPGGGA